MKFTSTRLVNNVAAYLVILVLSMAIISCTAPFKKAPHQININKLRPYKKIKDIPIMDQSKKLEEAYTLQSDSLLNEFFSEWRNDGTVRNDAKYSKPEVKAAYEIFQDLYKPDLSDSSKSCYSVYSRAEFIVVQNHLRLYMMKDRDSLLSGFHGFMDSILIKLDSVSDFRPDVHFADKKTLYLSKDYQIALDQFFFSFLGADDEGYIYSDSMFIIDKRKMAFLAPKIQVAPEHWGSGFYYVSFPEVERMIFNEDYTKARVSFRATYASGGYAYYEKEDSLWVQKEYNPRLWVE
jgi:hypothetical protein